MADVTDLDEAREKKAKKAVKAKEDTLEKLTFPQVCDAMAEQIEGSPLAPFDSVPFPVKYHAVESASPGAKFVLEERAGIVSPTNLDSMADEIVKYGRLRGVQSISQSFLLTHPRARDVARFWLATARAIPEPPAFRWADEPGLTYCRLPWSYSPNPVQGSCPTWEALLARMTNREAFAAWIGSLFDLKSNIQQYVFMHGLGNDGKSSISRILRSVFGKTYVSKQPPERGDKFWACDLVGTRLAVFPDCNSRSFVSGGFFKTLTGGDPISIENKYEKRTTYKLNTKFLFISNEMPVISSEIADRRRIILCSLDRRDTPDEADFEARLWAEGGAFFSNCVDHYQKNYPTHLPIDADMSHVDDWVSTVEEDFEEVFSSLFVVEPFSGLAKDAPNVPANIVWSLLIKNIAVNRQRLDFIAWMRRKHGIKKVQINEKEGRKILSVEKRYLGMTIKPPSG